MEVTTSREDRPHYSSAVTWDSLGSRALPTDSSHLSSPSSLWEAHTCSRALPNLLLSIPRTGRPWLSREESGWERFRNTVHKKCCGVALPHFKQDTVLGRVTWVQLDKLLCRPQTVLHSVLHGSLNTMISILTALMFGQVVQACAFVV